MDKPIGNKNDFSTYGKVVGFLAIEILAILAFQLGNSFLFFTLCGVVLTIVLSILTFSKIKKEGLLSFVLFSVPLILFGIISALSSFTKDSSFALNRLSFLIPICLAGFAASGYLVSLTGEFKVRNALFAIYASLTLLSLINLLATIIQFGFFHTTLYQGYFLYYLGHPSDVPLNHMAYGLVGFSFEEISLQSFSLMPSLLLTAFIPLFFMKPKEDKAQFFSYLSFGLVGVLSLALCANKLTLISDLFILITIFSIILAVKIKKSRIPIYVCSGIFLSGVAIVFVLILLNSQGEYGSSIPFIQNLLSKGFLDRLFNGNSLVVKYNSILDGIFTKFKFFGTNMEYLNYEYLERPSTVITDSNSILFDTFLSSGVLGFAILLVWLVFSFIGLFRYIANGKDCIKEKVSVLGFILVFFVYALVAYDMSPETFYSELIPFYLNGIFLVVVFLLGYATFNSKKNKESEGVENA